jgi:hypothetical protein
VNEAREQAAALTKRWPEITAQDVSALNNELQASGLPPLRLEP